VSEKRELVRELARMVEVWGGLAKLPERHIERPLRERALARLPEWALCELLDALHMAALSPPETR